MPPSPTLPPLFGKCKSFHSPTLLRFRFPRTFWRLPPYPSPSSSSIVSTHIIHISPYPLCIYTMTSCHDNTSSSSVIHSSHHGNVLVPLPLSLLPLPIYVIVSCHIVMSSCHTHMSLCLCQCVMSVCHTYITNLIRIHLDNIYVTSL